MKNEALLTANLPVIARYDLACQHQEKSLELAREGDLTGAIQKLTSAQEMVGRMPPSQRQHITVLFSLITLSGEYLSKAFSKIMQEHVTETGKLLERAARNEAEVVDLYEELQKEFVQELESFIDRMSRVQRASAVASTLSEDAKAIPVSHLRVMLAHLHEPNCEDLQHILHS